MSKSTTRRRHRKPPACRECGSRTVGTRKPLCLDCTRFTLGTAFLAPIPFVVPLNRKGQ